MFTEVYASKLEQDIIANELCFLRKPLYKGDEADDILTYLEGKLDAGEAHSVGGSVNEYDLMRKSTPKETKKILGIVKKRVRKEIPKLSKRSIMASPKPVKKVSKRKSTKS